MEHKYAKHAEVRVGKNTWSKAFLLTQAPQSAEEMDPPFPPVSSDMIIQKIFLLLISERAAFRQIQEAFCPPFSVIQ